MQILWMLFACITDAQNASFLTHLWLLVEVISWWVYSSSTIACNSYHVPIKLLVPFWCTTANCVIQICSIQEIRQLNFTFTQIYLKLRRVFSFSTYLIKVEMKLNLVIFLKIYRYCVSVLLMYIFQYILYDLFHTFSLKLTTSFDFSEFQNSSYISKNYHAFLLKFL